MWSASACARPRSLFSCFPFTSVFQIIHIPDKYPHAVHWFLFLSQKGHSVYVMFGIWGNPLFTHYLMVKMIAPRPPRPTPFAFLLRRFLLACPLCCGRAGRTPPCVSLWWSALPRDNARLFWRGVFSLHSRRSMCPHGALLVGILPSTQGNEQCGPAPHGPTQPLPQDWWCWMCLSHVNFLLQGVLALVLGPFSSWPLPAFLIDLFEFFIYSWYKPFNCWVNYTSSVTATWPHA